MSDRKHVLDGSMMPAAIDARDSAKEQDPRSIADHVQRVPTHTNARAQTIDIRRGLGTDGLAGRVDAFAATLDRRA